MVTIYDIAKKANCSAMTVSRVINNSGRISEKTRKRIKAIMEELNYVPNSTARSLVLQETKTISLLITDITNPFFTILARGAEDTAKKNGYNLILSNSDENLLKERDYIETMLSYRVDGVLIAPAGDKSLDHLKMLRRHNIPFVVLDRAVEGIDTDSVLGDSREGAKNLVEYLISLGHQRIAILNGSIHVSTARLRYEGYCEVLNNHGIQLDPELVFETGYMSSETEGIIQLLLEHPNPPTAIFAANNVIALSAIRSLRSKQLRVPQDISVVGFDDLETAYLVDPFLTTIAQPAYEFGSIGMQLLIDRIQKHTMDWKNIILPSKLVIRQSAVRK
jgi:LacI family transcriptional regulator